MTMVKRARLMTIESPNTIPHLPLKLVFKILIKLPVKSLLRFKTVCKDWRTMIQQEDFVLSHDDDHNPIVPFIPDHNHAVVAYCGGIVLEQNLISTKLRVRNPCLRLVLDLPDPSKTSSAMDFAYDGQFKLISFYDDEGNKGCQILTFNEDHLSWKTVPAPPDFSNKNRKVLCSRRDSEWVVLYFWTDTSDRSRKNSKIGFESFDVKSESFSSTCLSPPDFFCDFPKVDTVGWNDTLAVCAIENEEKKLHATLLKDFEKQRWSEKMTFDLKFLEARPVMRSFPLSLVEVTDQSEYIFCSHGEVEVRVDRDLEVVNLIGEFMIEDKRILRPLPRFNLRHTLVAFRGMKPETI